MKRERRDDRPTESGREGGGIREEKYTSSRLLHRVSFQMYSFVCWWTVSRSGDWDKVVSVSSTLRLLLLSHEEEVRCSGGRETLNCLWSCVIIPEVVTVTSWTCAPFTSSNVGRKNSSPRLPERKHSSVRTLRPFMSFVVWIDFWELLFLARKLDFIQLNLEKKNEIKVTPVPLGDVLEESAPRRGGAHG